MVLLSSGVAARPAARRRDLPTHVRPGKKTRLVRHFCIKTIILPRQARDKHSQSTQKQMMMRSRSAGGARRLRRGGWADDGKPTTKRLCCQVFTLRRSFCGFVVKFYTKTIVLPRQARDKTQGKRNGCSCLQAERRHVCYNYSWDKECGKSKDIGTCGNSR